MYIYNIYIMHLQFYRIYSNHVHRIQDQVGEDLDYEMVYQKELVDIVFDIM